MSILFAVAVSLFLSFFPTVMTVYYKSPSGVIIATAIFNIIGYFTFGIGTLIAFIIAVCALKFLETLKSILFAIFLLVISTVLFATEMTYIISKMS